jgi:hypothetical protein
MATSTLLHNGFSTRPIVSRAGRDPSSASGLPGRLWAALSKSRRRGEEAEIAAYVEMRGGRITDALERDIERRFMFGRF